MEGIWNEGVFNSSSSTQFKDIKKLVAGIVSGRETSIHDERKDDSSTRKETRKTKRMTDQPPVCQQLELVTSISEEADKALLWEHSNRDAPRREATRSEKGIEGQRTAFSQQSNTGEGESRLSLTSQRHSTMSLK